MTDYSTPECRPAELGAILAQCGAGPIAPFRIGRTVAAMLELARVAKRTAENECNYAYSERQLKAHETRLERLASAVRDALDDCAIPRNVADIRHGGDPRGACCWLVVPSMKGDGWTAGEYAVYS